MLAARQGAEVIAIDSDPAVISELWRQASQGQTRILPLVCDFSRPSAALGWRNSEQRSFLDRAFGAVDLVLLLAVVHHLVIGEGIPFGEILDVLRIVGADHVIMEVIWPDDEEFGRLIRGRPWLVQCFDRAEIEAQMLKHYQVVARQPLKGDRRTIYLLKRLSPSSRTNTDV